jgi:hypothetical protein
VTRGASYRRTPTPPRAHQVPTGVRRVRRDRRLRKSECPGFLRALSKGGIRDEIPAIGGSVRRYMGNLVGPLGYLAGWLVPFRPRASLDSCPRTDTLAAGFDPLEIVLLVAGVEDCDVPAIGWMYDNSSVDIVGVEVTLRASG